MEKTEQKEMKFVHHAITLAAYLKRGKNVTSWQGVRCLKIKYKVLRTTSFKTKRWCLYVDLKAGPHCCHFVYFYFLMEKCFQILLF